MSHQLMSLKSQVSRSALLHIIFTYSIPIVNDNVVDVIEYVHYWCSVLFYLSTITLSMFECGSVVSSSTESFKKKLYSHQPFLQQQTGSPAVIIVTLFTSPPPLHTHYLPLPSNDLWEGWYVVFYVLHVRLGRSTVDI